MKLLSALLLEEGQGLTEYALILGVVVIAAIAGVAAAGSSLLSLYSGVRGEID